MSKKNYEKDFTLDDIKTSISKRVDFLNALLDNIDKAVNENRFEDAEGYAFAMFELNERLRKDLQEGKSKISGGN